jgi:hypothetical protein
LEGNNLFLNPAIIFKQKKRWYMLKPIFYFTVSFCFLFYLPILVLAEEITITTYYPSPYGSYNYLQTDKLGVGDNNGDGAWSSADVPTTTGDVWIAGKVGIGTAAPLHKLTIGNPTLNPGSVDSNDVVAIGTGFGAYRGILLSGGTSSGYSGYTNVGALIQNYFDKTSGSEYTMLSLGTKGYGGVANTLNIRNGNVGIRTTNPQADLHIGSGGLGYISRDRMIIQPPQHTGGP